MHEFAHSRLADAGLVARLTTTRARVIPSSFFFMRSPLRGGAPGDRTPAKQYNAYFQLLTRVYDVLCGISGTFASAGTPLEGRSVPPHGVQQLDPLVPAVHGNLQPIIDPSPRRLVGDGIELAVLSGAFQRDGNVRVAGGS